MFDDDVIQPSTSPWASPVVHGPRRRFVPNFSKIADPLTQLVKDDVAFVWGPIQSDAIRDLQQNLQTPPILFHFDTEADTEVRTDASNLGLGAILVQCQDDVERIIAYASRT